MTATTAPAPTQGRGTGRYVVYVLAQTGPGEHHGKDRYVGYTCNPKRRMSGHVSEKRGASHRTCWLRREVANGTPPLMRIVSRHATREEALATEVITIAMARACGVPIVNLTNGGEGACGFRFSEEAKARMSSVRIGHPVSPGTRAKIGAGNSGDPFYDQFDRCYATQGEAARTLGVPQAEVSNVLRGTARHTHGYRFSYTRPVSPEPLDSEREIHGNRRRIYDQYGRSYESHSEAGTRLGVSRANVSNVLSGKRKHTRGYRFTYDPPTTPEPLPAGVK